MEIRPYQICVSADGWYPIRVESSNQDAHYTVMVSPWGEQDDHICECAGYTYRGSCRHQELAQRFRCGWKAIESDIVQNESQKQDMTCPKCSGQTKWTIEVK
jgi:hypothetical protein